MILSIPMQLEAAKKETGVEFIEIEDERFNIIKKNILEKLGISISNESNFMWDNLLIILIFVDNLPGSIFLKYCGKKNVVCSLIRSNAGKHICLKTAGIYVM